MALDSRLHLSFLSILIFSFYPEFTFFLLSMEHPRPTVGGTAKTRRRPGGRKEEVESEDRESRRRGVTTVMHWLDMRHEGG